METQEISAMIRDMCLFLDTNDWQDEADRVTFETAIAIAIEAEDLE